MPDSRGSRIICASAFYFQNFLFFLSQHKSAKGEDVPDFSRLFRTLSKNTHRQPFQFCRPFENIQLDKNFYSTNSKLRPCVWDCCCITTIKEWKQLVNIVDSGCTTFFFRFFVCFCLYFFFARDVAFKIWKITRGREKDLEGGYLLVCMPFLSLRYWLIASPCRETKILWRDVSARFRPFFFFFRQTENSIFHVISSTLCYSQRERRPNSWWLQRFGEARSMH